MMIDLGGKSAIVTGGASGIGRGICMALAQQGAKVVVADMNGQGAESVASEVGATGTQSTAIIVDVTDRTSIDRMVAQSLEKFGGIDILVNDAGVVGVANWWEHENPTDEDWDLVLAVNLRGVVMVSESVASHMRERRYGKIVNIASIAARYGNAALPHYSASKAAVASWTQSNALQLAPYNINVNAICPGLLWTPIWEQIARNLQIQRGPSVQRPHRPGLLQQVRGILDSAEEGTDSRGYRQACGLPGLRRFAEYHRPGDQRGRRQANELMLGRGIRHLTQPRGGNMMPLAEESGRRQPKVARRNGI
jgi:meso-butanediol dehydrogenase/(S,S)-butanediol dehydrogenase/diacetyl reductase